MVLLINWNFLGWFASLKLWSICSEDFLIVENFVGTGDNIVNYNSSMMLSLSTFIVGNKLN